MGKITINIDDKLKNEFKAEVSRDGKKITEVIIDFIKKYIGNSNETI